MLVCNGVCVYVGRKVIGVRVSSRTPRGPLRCVRERPIVQRGDPNNTDLDGGAGQLQLADDALHPVVVADDHGYPVIELRLGGRNARKAPQRTRIQHTAPLRPYGGHKAGSADTEGGATGTRCETVS